MKSHLKKLLVIRAFIHSWLPAVPKGQRDKEPSGMSYCLASYYPVAIVLL